AASWQPSVPHPAAATHPGRFFRGTKFATASSIRNKLTFHPARTDAKDASHKLFPMSSQREVVIITGIAGGIGSRVASALEDEFCVVGMDLDCEEDERNFPVDLSSDESVNSALRKIQERFGKHLASVVHLAAYFDFSGEDNPLYQEVNVDGTRRLLDGLQGFEVEQLLYSSTMLVHEP